jgi:SAM-dependent methyltransferase
MSHAQQQYFCKLVEKNFFERKKISILEIGSYNVNGTIRDIFVNQKYIGVDVKKGPCVDIVYDGQNLDIKDKFDLSISCECFEHNPFYLENFKKMIELTKNDGVVVFTCASLFRKEHGTTRTTSADSPGSMEKWDYYKNLFKKDFEKKIDMNKTFYKYQFYYNLFSDDLYFIGIKNDNHLENFKSFNHDVTHRFQNEISQHPISFYLLFFIFKKIFIKMQVKLTRILKKYQNN